MKGFKLKSNLVVHQKNHCNENTPEDTAPDEPVPEYQIEKGQKGLEDRRPRCLTDEEFSDKHCAIFPDKTDEVLHNAKETIQNPKQSGEKVKHGEAFKTRTKNKVEDADKEELPVVKIPNPHAPSEGPSGGSNDAENDPVPLALTTPEVRKNPPQSSSSTTNDLHWQIGSDNKRVRPLFSGPIHSSRSKCDLCNKTFEVYP